MKIILTGYMGSGKTTVARFLSEETGWPMVDLDNLIEKRAGMAVTDIFSSKGELWFRKMEHAVLQELLSSESNLILATGGGTPCYFNNHELLNAEGTESVYLLTPIPAILERLENETAQRPLLAGLSPGERTEFIAKHLFDRSFYYNQAKHVITTNNKLPAAIVAEIMEKLHL